MYGQAASFESLLHRVRKLHSETGDLAPNPINPLLTARKPLKPSVWPLGRCQWRIVASEMCAKFVIGRLFVVPAAELIFLRGFSA